jgi:hypothetical protein
MTSFDARHTRGIDQAANLALSNLGQACSKVERWSEALCRPDVPHRGRIGRSPDWPDGEHLFKFANRCSGLI